MTFSLQDLRLAARTLQKRPGFTTVAVLSLALAIALNTTMYGVTDALVHPRVDMRQPDRLYHMRYYGNMRRRLSQQTIEEALRSGLHGYEAVTGSTGYGRASTAERGNAVRQGMGVVVVRPDYFEVLGVRPSRGRLLSAVDVGQSAGTPAVLSERLVSVLFADGSDPLGQTIRIDENDVVVVGVLGPTSDFPRSRTDVWLLPPPGSRDPVPLNIIRLREGASIPAVASELAVLAARLADEAGESHRDTRFDFRPATDPQFSYQKFHIALIAAVVAILLVACSNLANLQLARGIGRGRELALRAALGASRADLVMQLLVESCLLAVAGLLVGVVLTFWGIHFLSASIPRNVGYYIVAPQMSWRVFAFAILASVVCTVLVGLVPALRASRADPNEMLKSAAGTGANKRHRREYGLLVVSEIALSLALLTAAALVVRQAWRIDQVKFGYDPKPLAVATAWTNQVRTSVVHVDGLAAEFVARVRAMPGVADAAVSRNAAPPGNAIEIVDATGAQREVPSPMWGYRRVSPSFLRTLRLPILKGRDFAEGERDGEAVIVDQPTATYLWPGGNPIGAMIKLGDEKSTEGWVRVVGVVGQEMDVSAMARFAPGATRLASRLGTVYRLITAADSIVPRNGEFAASITLTARATGDPARLPLILRRALTGVPGVRFVMTTPMEDYLQIPAMRASQHFVSALFTAFAALAIGLASLGIHGIVAHSVAERKRELGVRIALGGTARHILSVVLHEGNAVALAGIAFGLLLTKYDVVWLRAFTTEDDAYSAGLFGAMAAVLLIVTAAAAFVPALRATRVNPVEAMRSE